MKKRISVSEVGKRIAGFSTPFFGLSFHPAVYDSDVARQLLTFLEDRRVLYDPLEAEIPSFAIRSILQIRERLTEALQKLPPSSPLVEVLKTLRAACRKFLNQTQGLPSIDHPLNHGLSMRDELIFLSALGEFRGIFGIQVALIALKYKIDVEASLASIFPLEPE